VVVVFESLLISATRCTR